MLATVIFLSAWVPAGVLISPALAHGTSTSSSAGAMALLIFPAAAILFGLFLVFTHEKKGWTVLVTGGAGYVGSALVPELLRRGHSVIVLDPYLHGDDVFNAFHGYENLREVKGDIRDQPTLELALKGCDGVIHLAHLSDGLSPDRDSAKSVNHDAFGPLVRAARKAGVKRFMYASSFRVYGDRGGAEATEDLPLAPAGADAKDKAFCEQVLTEERASGFVTCTVRPGAVCGDGPGRRHDNIVSTFAKAAIDQGQIRVLGGNRKHPFIHIDDMVAFYLFLLNQPDIRIDGRAFNACTENLTYLELAEVVKNVAGGDISIDLEPADEPYACHLSTDRMRHQLGFVPTRGVEDAVRDRIAALRKSADLPRHRQLHG
jgi:nucleoside-diphosphate-sugar epimerase